MKKIMLQGYVNSSNFGDMLFAQMFYRKCKELGLKKIDFFQYDKKHGISSFCRKGLGYTEKKNLFSSLAADAFVLIPGGYLWNDGRYKRDALSTYMRFVLPARLYQCIGKPVYVLGCGGGPVDTLWLRKSIIRMLEKAKKVYFRDTATKKVFEEYGVKNRLTVTADAALMATPDMLPAFEEKHELDTAANGRKKLLLHVHVPRDPELRSRYMDMVLPSVIDFLKAHKDYLLVLAQDSVFNVPEVEKIYKKLDDSGTEYYKYQYHDCLQMASLINEMDCIVTVKLHTGVVGCALGKSVIAFPAHRDKVDNFYAEIGELDRCCNLKRLTRKIADRQLEELFDKPVIISDELRKKAALNLEALCEIIQ